MRRRLPAPCQLLLLAALATASLSAGCGGGDDDKASATLPVTTKTPSGAQLVVISTPAPKGSPAGQVCGAEQLTRRNGAQEVTPFCAAPNGQATAFVEGGPKGAAHIVLAVPSGAGKVVLDGNGKRRINGTIAKAAKDGDARLGMITAPKSALPGRIVVSDGDGKTLVASDPFGAPTCRSSSGGKGKKRQKQTTKNLSCTVQVALHAKS